MNYRELFDLHVYMLNANAANQWNDFVAQVRKNNPDIDAIEPAEKRWGTFAIALKPMVNNYLHNKNILDRIEAGAEEYEEAIAALEIMESTIQ